MRRPLASVCLVICILIFIYVKATECVKQDYGLWKNGDHLTLSGEVISREIKNDSLVIVLKKVTFCDLNNSNITIKDKVICYLEGDYEIPLGSFVMLEGEAGEFRKASNEGEFDLERYYRSLGYGFPMYKCRILKQSESFNIWWEKLEGIKKRLSDIADTIFIPEDSGIMKAMILGEKDEISQEIKELYQDSGISHIIAISGLHVSLIGMFIYGLLKKAGANVYLRTLIPLILLLNYALMVGVTISSFRAVFMFLLMMFAYLCRRSYDIVTALALAATALLLTNIYIVEASALYLSFASVMAVAVFSTCLTIKDDSVKMKKLINNFLSGASISIFTLPLILEFYYEYPLYSVLINLLIIPLMTILLGIGIVAVLIGIISIPLASAFAYICHLILMIYKMACLIATKLPFHRIIIGKPDNWQIVVFYIILLLLYKLNEYVEEYNRKEDLKLMLYHRRGKEYQVKKYSIKMRYKILILLLAICCLVKIPDKMSIYMLDVGQGDGLCIINGYNAYMLDAGSSSEKDIARYKIIPFLKSKSVSRIKLWAISHTDSDHYSALKELLEMDNCNIKIDRILLADVEGINETGADLIRAIKAKNIPIEYISRGDVIKDGDMKMTFINPSKGHSSEDINTLSQVILFEYKGYKGLFTGDATSESEKIYMSYCQDNGIDIFGLDFLKVPHHGSSTSSSDELIRLIRPSVALISSGRNNRYGHPTKEVLDRLSENGSVIFNTQSSGEIKLVFSNKGIIIKEFLKGM